MSKGLENFLPFITPANVDYPYGDIKDDTGAGDGTAVNRANHADYHQTFRKLLALSDIIPNNLPDNVDNGFQYIEALDKLYKRFIGSVVINATASLNFSDIGKHIEILGNTTNIQLVLTNDNECRDGDKFCIYNNENYQCEVLASGATIDGSTVMLYRKGDFLEVQLDKANQNWKIVNYKATMINPIITVGSGGSAPVFQNSWLANSPLKFFIDEKDFVHINGIVHKVGAISGFTNLICTLPVGYRPTTPFTIWVWYYDSGTIGQVPLNFLSNGDVTIDNTQLSVFSDTIIRIQAIHFYKNW